MISAGIRGLSQTVVVFLFAIVLQIHLRLTLFSLLGVFVIIMLGAGFFSGLSMIVASIVKTRERFMGIGQVLTQPLFFASNAIYPIEIMPAWLKIIAKVNPLSYVVNGLRALLLTGNNSQALSSIAVLLAITFFMSLLTSYMYPKVAS